MLYRIFYWLSSQYCFKITVRSVLARMEDDLKSRMVRDLKNKFESLCLMKMQPQLHLSERMNEITNRIDYDAELLIAELEANTEPTENAPTSLQINEARCELVRILKIVAENLHLRLLENASNELESAFVSLQERVDEFESTPFTPEDEINDLEDSYVKLVLDITEMANSVENRIFGGQSIFYLSSTEENKLGRLFHLTDIFLTADQKEYLR